MISDYYSDKFRRLMETVSPGTYVNPMNPTQEPIVIVKPLDFQASDPVRDKAREFVEDFKELYEKAKLYDAETGQPDCELDEKKQTLKRLAKMLGVEIDFL